MAGQSLARCPARGPRRGWAAGLASRWLRQPGTRHPFARVRRVRGRRSRPGHARMRHHTNMSGSPDVQQAQFHLNRLSGRPLFECGGVNGLQLDFGPPGFPKLIIEGPFTITLPDATAVTGCEALDEFVIVTVPGFLVNQQVDATIAEDGQLTLRFAGGTTLTVPPDDKCEAWQLRDDTGLLIVCM